MIKESKVKFNVRKHIPSYMPSLELSIEEQKYLQSSISDKVRLIPDILHDLLGPSASFCRIDKIVNTLKLPVLGSSINGGFEFFIMDYYNSWFRIPSFIKFNKKTTNRDYRKYLIDRYNELLIDSIEVIYLSELLPKLEIDHETINVQLKGHPYLSTKLEISLPIIQNWLKAYSQKNWEKIKDLLDSNQPAIVLLVGSTVDLFNLNLLIVNEYKILDDFTLILAGYNKKREHITLKLYFKAGIHIENKDCNSGENIIGIHCSNYLQNQIPFRKWWKWF